MRATNRYALCWIRDFLSARYSYNVEGIKSGAGLAKMFEDGLRTVAIILRETLQSR
jgi:hypothetical protein